ncbi:hypothetical protein WI90_31150 [Burkholderia ubonensis]|nr:hypothetical protein WI90_31150 [Burkholderia ubonensis]
MLNWGASVGPGAEAIVEHLLTHRQHPEMGCHACLGLPAAEAAALDTTGRTLTRAQWQYVLQTVLRPQSAFDVSGEQVANQAAHAGDAFLLAVRVRDRRIGRDS